MNLNVPLTFGIADETESDAEPTKSRVTKAIQGAAVFIVMVPIFWTIFSRMTADDE